MKKTLSVAVLFGGLAIVSAQVPNQTNQILYQETWLDSQGTGANAVTQVGWQQAIGSATVYTGTYGQAGSYDSGTKLFLAATPLYFSSPQAGEVGAVFTTDALGAGTGGATAFADINPANYSNITFNVECQASANFGSISNFWAVQVAGTWYISTNTFTNVSATSGATFRLNSLQFNPAATGWNTLILDLVDTPNTATIGPAASAPLSGLITGVGLVQAWSNTLVANSTPGINYLNYFITAPINNPTGTAPLINGPGYSQTVYTGSGASFAVSTGAGSPTLTYSWQLNGGANLADGPTGSGSTIIGSGTGLLTISNAQPTDAGTYTAVVANSVNSDTTANYATNVLTVNAVPADVLYSESFPYVGPYATGEFLTNVGWAATLSPTNVPQRLEVRAGTGIVNAFETAARTVAYTTTTNTELGSSGLPFTAINPANYTYVSFRASLPTTGGSAAYFAVRMSSGQWYVASSPIQTTTPVTAPNTFGIQFSTAVSSWNLLTLGASSATIGAAPAAPLSGNITGAGMVFVYTGASQYTMTNFAVVTDQTPPVAPLISSEPNVPYPQTVYAGGGAAFSITEAGTSPLTNNWEFNDSGVYLVDGTNADGSVFTGTQTTRINVLNAQAGESGLFSAFVSNPANSPQFAAPITSTDNSTFGSPSLTVNAPPIGLIYDEEFPLYSTFTGNQAMSLIGWTNQSSSASRIFKINAATVGTGAASAFESSANENDIYDIYFASTTSDTGFSGLPFIAFDPSLYPANSIQFTTTLAQGNAAYTNVAVSVAVRQGGQWYINTTPFWPLYTNAPPATGMPTTYTMQFSQTYSPAASQWDSMTILAGVNSLGSLTNASGVQTNVTGVVVNGNPAQNLSGSIDAAGLVFHFIKATGGDINFDQFIIQATGAGNLIGGVNSGAFSTNGVTLTWIGNPAVNLQSADTVPTTSWTDVPNTLGQHSLTVTPGALQKYYRVFKH